MTNWSSVRPTLKRPVYRSLTELISRMIERNELTAGARLPTHRDLAHQLGVSVQTVSRAYDDLTRLGLIAGAVGRGTFVRSERPESAQPFIPGGSNGEVTDLSILKPVGGRLHVDRMAGALRRLADDLPNAALFSFRPSPAQRHYREIAVDWLRVCGVETAAKSVHITNGATPAMTSALLSAARPGDLVVAEAIGHHTLRALTGYLGLRLRGLELDDDGIVPDAFDQVCRTEPVKVLFLVPSAANPTVTMVSLARREALVEIARRHDVAIVENDAWGPLVEKRPPPFAHLAPERTYYVTSFTKCALPGLRVGYLVTPDRKVASTANRHLVTNWSATALMAEIATRWVEDGTAAELLVWQRAALRERNDIVAETLGDIAHHRYPESLHAWLPLPAAWREDEFVAHMRLNDVAVAPGASFAAEASVATSAVRISVGPTGAGELRRGLESIASVFRAEPEPALLAI